MVATLCEYGIGFDPRGLAVECGEPVTSARFAFCDRHRAGLIYKAPTAYAIRKQLAAATENDHE